MLKKLLFPSCLCLFTFAASAKADTIGPGSCGSCLGSSYTLSYTTTANPNAFDVFLTVNTTGFTNGSSDYLNAVSLKLVSQSSSITSVSLVAPIPATFSTTIAGGLNANGCSGNGGGFFCSESSGNGLQVGHAGNIYTFEWLVTVGAPGNLLTGIDDASVKALYVNVDGQQNGITSEDITLTKSTNSAPEPSTLLLLGTGLVSAAGVIRRKLHA
jgi:hypothetical protein